MAKSRRRSLDLKKLGNIGLAVLAVVTLGLAGWMIFKPEPTPQASEQVAKYYEENKTLKPAPTKEPAPKISIAPGTKSMFFGDSWTEGYGAASPATQGYAYLTSSQLQWDNEVKAVGGTGFQNPGPANTGSYAGRLSKLPQDPELQVLVIQGGINDASQPADAFRQAVLDVLDVAREKFPAAKIVLLGPGTPTVPASPQLAAINSKLYQIADEQKLNYISPISDLWINGTNYAQFIDASKTNHPSTAGHAYLAEKTVAALRAIGE